jgi:Lon protease-like protein
VTSEQWTFTCLGIDRIRLLNVKAVQDGLWKAVALVQSRDKHKSVPDDLMEIARRLQATLHNQDLLSKYKTLHFNDSGWVANRWCELLPLPLKEKEYLLMAMDSQFRLSEVSDFLNKSQGLLH